MKITIINTTKKLLDRTCFSNLHDVLVINTTVMNIKNCLGCFGCWHVTPGLCVQKDDMPKVLKAEINADLVVFITDVTAGFVSAEMKRINDKSIPLLSPFFELVEGEIHHAKRYEKYPDYGLILINSNDIPNEVFSIIDDCYKRYAINFRSELKFTMKDNLNLEGLKNEINNY